MIEFIDTISQFERLVHAPRAILALHAQWSFPSVQAMMAVEQWACQGFILDVPVFVAVTLPDDYHPHVVRWLQLQSLGALASTGGGEVTWLEHGQVVAKLLSKVTAAALTDESLRVWPLIADQPTAPRPDPLIDEIRAIRKHISDTHGNDVRRLAEHLLKVQRQYADRVVDEPPKPRASKKT
jgi:hypothetical protein